MKNVKQPLLELRAKVLMVFENKNNIVNHNSTTDPTTTLVTTMTGTGIELIKKENIKGSFNSPIYQL